MGQAFRRATGRIIGNSRVDTSPSQLKKPLDVRPPPKNVPVENSGGPAAESTPAFKSKNVREERDLQYDAMLSQMVGRIQTKPGGIHEMGEAFVAEKYSRPMPKLRNTSTESGRYEERPAPPGTLNVAQLRHIILLYQGKADDHIGSMDISQIAEKFKLDAAEVKTILQHVSLPPEDDSKKKDYKE